MPDITISVGSSNKVIPSVAVDRIQNTLDITSTDELLAAIINHLKQQVWMKERQDAINSIGIEPIDI